MDLRFLGTFDLVLSYARVSSQDQADRRKSIETQINRLGELIPPANFRYQDVMGGDESDRPGYQELKSKAKEEAIAGRKVLIVLTELDRLSRDQAEINATIEEFDILGITLYALDGGRYTAKEPHDWLRTSQEGMFAEYYLRALRNRLRKSKEQRRREGKPAVGRAPFGYRWTREKLVPDPEKWAIARQLVEAYLPPPQGQGLTLHKLRVIANEKGVKFSRSGLRVWLLNPALRGHLVYSIGGYNNEERKRGVKSKPKELRYNTHEALISEAEYRVIERQLKENRRYYGANAEALRHPYSGLVVCGHCSKRMGRVSAKARSGPDYEYYYCNDPLCPQKRIRLQTIEDAAIAALVARAETLTDLALVPDPENPNAELLEAERQLEEIEGLYKRTNMQSLLGPIAELRQKLKDLQQPIEAQTANESDRELLLQNVADSDVWEDLNNDEKRLILHELIRRIVVSGKQVTEVLLWI